MITHFLEIILSPIILAMELIFDMIRSIIGSAGWSIVLLSFVMTIVTHPLRNWGQSVEKRVQLRKQAVDAKIAATTVALKGEQKFRAVERIYKTHNYHPIHSVALGTPLFIMLPFLLSALFLFSSNTSLEGVSFLFIHDLSRPDGLFAGFNMLPVLMTGITLIDSRVRLGADRSAFFRFLFIALILFVLVYDFSSAIVLFWTVSNLIAMFGYFLRHPESKT